MLPGGAFHLRVASPVCLFARWGLRKTPQCPPHAFRWGCIFARRRPRALRGAVPFSPRKGNRKWNLRKRGRRGQETRLPPDVWLEVWFESALRPRTSSGILVAPGRPWLHLRGHSGATKRLPPALGFPVGNPEGLEEAFEDPQMNLKSVYRFLLEGAKRLKVHLRIRKRTSTEPQRRMHANI